MTAPKVTDADLIDIRTALLGLVEVVERVMGKEPRTAEIRRLLRECQWDSKRAEELTLGAECDKL